jgi:hypothetical protein
MRAVCRTKYYILALLALVPAACAAPDYRNYDPATVGYNETYKLRRAKDLDWCRKAVALFDRGGPSAGEVADGTFRGAESGAGVALLYSPAIGIGGVVGLVNTLAGNVHSTNDIRMLDNCLAGQGQKHDYIVIDANR